MDFLKDVFGDKAITYSELEKALQNNKDVKLANLANGDYVDKGKYTAKENELIKANETIQQLQETVKKFDGVDVDALNEELKNMQEKYDLDIAAIKKDSAVSMALANAEARNIKAVKALLDMDAIVCEGEEIKGLSEQIEQIKKDNDYLFGINTVQPVIEKPINPPPVKTQPQAYLDEFYANNPFYKK